MEYLTLLNYLYTITYTYRTDVIRKVSAVSKNRTFPGLKQSAFFLNSHLTLLNKLNALKHQHSAH